MSITMKIMTGSAAEERLDALATLRLDIFREYPYLYDGLREDELKYLRLYVETSDAFLIMVTDAEQVAGAATGTPLCSENQSLLKPFIGTYHPVNETFYVGELLFYPAYRGRGLGLQLLAIVEEHVRTMGKYRYLTCATVARPVSHSLRPEDYVPIDRFLSHTGFVKLSGITTSFSWKEIDGISREHPMQFWIKELN